jgi:hypothetical protein
LEQEKTEMITGIHQQAAANAREERCERASDRQLWAAVLLQALEDWGSSNIRLRTEADKFFFQNESYFAMVCRGAGLESGSVLNRLQKMKRGAATQPVFRLPLAA